MRAPLLALALALVAASGAALAHDPVRVSPRGDAHAVIAASGSGTAIGSVAVSVWGDAYSYRDTCAPVPDTIATPPCTRVIPLASVSVFGNAGSDKVAVSVFGHAHGYAIIGVSGCDAAGLCGLP